MTGTPTDRSHTMLLLAAASTCAACAGPSEAPRVMRDVHADASALAPITNDLGFDVLLLEARVALSDLAFTVAGEQHEARLWDALGHLLVGRALAHPGHFEGGGVTGELRGRFVVDWLAEPSLGAATLLAGEYEGMDFLFERASTKDGLPKDDPLVGHTARLVGEATRGSDTVAFEAVIDSPEGRVLQGAPFTETVTVDSTSPLGFRLLLEDPFEGDTLFDGIDFAALDEDGDGHVSLDASSEGVVQDAYNLLRRTFQTHDHFDVQSLE